MDDVQEEEKFSKMKKTHFADLKPDDLNEIAIAKNVESDDDEDDEDDSSAGPFFKRDLYGVSFVELIRCVCIMMFDFPPSEKINLFTNG